MIVHHHLYHQRWQWNIWKIHIAKHRYLRLPKFSWTTMIDTNDKIIDNDNSEFIIKCNEAILPKVLLISNNWHQYLMVTIDIHYHYLMVIIDNDKLRNLTAVVLRKLLIVNSSSLRCPDPAVCPVDLLRNTPLCLLVHLLLWVPSHQSLPLLTNISHHQSCSALLTLDDLHLWNGWRQVCWFSGSAYTFTSPNVYKGRKRKSKGEKVKHRRGL